MSLGLWVLVKKKGTAGEEEEKGGRAGLTSRGEVKEMKGWRLQSGTARALGWNRCGISLRDSPSIATAFTLPMLCNTSWFLYGSRKEGASSDIVLGVFYLSTKHGVQAENLLQQTALGLQSCDSHGNSGGSSEQDDGHTGSSGIR